MGDRSGTPQTERSKAQRHTHLSFFFFPPTSFSFASSCSSTSTFSEASCIIAVMQTSVPVWRRPRCCERAITDDHSMIHGTRTSSYNISCLIFSRRTWAGKGGEGGERYREG